MEKKQTKLVDIIKILHKPELQSIGPLIRKIVDINSRVNGLYNNSQIMLEIFNCIYYGEYTIHKGVYQSINVVTYHDRIEDIFLKVVVSDKTEECSLLLRKDDIDKSMSILDTVNKLIDHADKLLNDFDLYTERIFNDEYTTINTFDDSDREELLDSTTPSILTAFGSYLDAEKDIEAGTSMNHIDVSDGSSLTCIGLVDVVESEVKIDIDYAEVEYVLTYRKNNKLFLARIATDTEMKFRGLVGMGLDEDRFLPLPHETQVAMFREAISLVVLYVHSMDVYRHEAIDTNKLS